MLTDIITSAHQQNNPWWEGYPLDRLGDRRGPRRSPLGRYPNLEQFSRSDFKHQYKHIKENRLYILAAPNGIGKTATLCRVAKRFGEEDVIPAKNLFYIPCGKPVFKIGTEFPITDSFDWYLQNIYDSFNQRTPDEFAPERDDSEAEEDASIYLFLDDAHLIDDWAGEVSALLEAHSELSIITTTPSAEAIESEQFAAAEFSYESDILLPRKFHDWATSFKQSDFESSKPIKSHCRDIRDSFANYAIGRQTEIEESVKQLLEEISAEPGDPDRLLVRYLRSGDHHRPGSDVDHNIQLAFYRDMPQIQSISSPSELHVLAAIAAVDAGNPRTMKDWSSMLDVDRRTLDRYLELLEEFYLVTSSSHYEHDVRRSLRLYPRDPAHIQALAEGNDVSTSSQNRVLMSVLFDHCKRLTYHLNDRDTPVEYWESGTSVIDYIIDLDDEECALPITFARDGDIDRAVYSVQQFCDPEDTDRPTRGLVISPDSNEEPRVDSAAEALVLPAWLFLFIV